MSRNVMIAVSCTFSTDSLDNTLNLYLLEILGFVTIIFMYLCKKKKKKIDMKLLLFVYFVLYLTFICSLLFSVNIFG